MLLLGRGEPVLHESIIEVLWGSRPPNTAQAQIYSTMSRLRQHLGQDVIVRVGHGFAVSIEDHDLDLVRFEQLTAHAGRIGQQDPAGATELLTTALSLWQGAALGGQTGPVLGAAARELDDQRIAWQRRRIEYGLSAMRLRPMRGRHDVTFTSSDVTFMRHASAV